MLSSMTGKMLLKMSLNLLPRKLSARTYLLLWMKTKNSPLRKRRKRKTQLLRNPTSLKLVVRVKRRELLKRDQVVQVHSMRLQVEMPLQEEPDNLLSSRQERSVQRAPKPRSCVVPSSVSWVTSIPARLLFSINSERQTFRPTKPVVLPSRLVPHTSLPLTFKNILMSWHKGNSSNLNSPDS